MKSSNKKRLDKLRAVIKKNKKDCIEEKRSPLTTLCYIEKDEKYLMMHRISKENDINKDKWIGVGGHFERDESPEECLLREVREETGLTLKRFEFRAVITFVSDNNFPEYMCLFTADDFTGDLLECSEGKLEWIPKCDIPLLNLWEGDKIFFRLLDENIPFFSLKLKYEKDTLVYACLNGKRMDLM